MGVNAKPVIDTLRAREKELSVYGVSGLAVLESLIDSSSETHWDIDLLWILLCWCALSREARRL